MRSMLIPARLAATEIFLVLQVVLQMVQMEAELSAFPIRIMPSEKELLRFMLAAVRFLTD